MGCVMLSIMPAVFVHGNPETASLWNELRSSLRRPDHVALSLPGFGCARPSGFGATKDEYADWLAEELERLGEPVDLVGHDWGGFLAVRVASLRGDLLRSWASDATGAFDQGFEWHRWARTWQRPGDGEAWVSRALATPIDIQAPGLAIIATADPFGREELFQGVADRTEARTLELDDLGHWWMLQDPRRGARALEDFWSSVRT